MAEKKTSSKRNFYNEIHDILSTAAKKSLMLRGSYEHEKILEHVGKNMRDIVDWTKVRELAALKFGESASGFIAVSARWFHPDDPCYKNRDGSATADNNIHPEKFLAKGTGKGAAGYALPSAVSLAMVEKQLEWRKSSEDGTHRSHADYRKFCADQGLLQLIEGGKTNVPMIERSAPEQAKEDAA
jgi:hypothetical protein